MGKVKGLWIVMAFVILVPTAVALAACSIATGSAPAISAQSENNNDVVIAIADQAFQDLNIDDECLVTNRRELEGPVETNGKIRIQGIMVVTSSCPGDSRLETEIQVFSIICMKETTLAVHAICDVKLVAHEHVDDSGGGSGRGR